ncbi:MAG: hypothetical protein JOY77_05805 [Alphaproteobacteria bacterium]|nr:hypothetical protein [Alphaproteobacteria bacterium]MBV9062426.1 hypothetical protein [Alphaproteobacteria bacterium]
MKSVLLGAAAILALTPGVAPAAGHHPSKVITGIKLQPGVHRPCGGGGLCPNWSQNSSDTGVGIDSQHFESTFANYNNSGADDFYISAKKALICDVGVTGVYYNGAGPASSFNVDIWKDNPGSDATRVAGVDNASYTQTGNVFDIDTTTGKKHKCIKLKGGKKGVAAHYWISVEANCAFSTCGQWGWELRPQVAGTSSAVWSEAGGFGTSCEGDDDSGSPGWNTLGVCIGSSYTGDDFMFGL